MDLLGKTEIAVRSYSILLSLIGLVLIFLWTKEISSKEADYIALFLGAINPFDIYFAQEVRGYMHTATLGMISSYCLWRWIRCVKNGLHNFSLIKWSIYYILSSAAVIYSHNVAVVILIAQGIYIVIWTINKRKYIYLFRYFLCSVCVVILFLPWLFEILDMRTTLYTAEKLNWIPKPPISDLFRYLGHEFFWSHILYPENKIWILY